VDSNDALNLALEHHRAGRLREAESLYREILVQQPNQADALHLLGVLTHQAGRQEEALGLIRRAAELNPSTANFHLSLGNVLAALGRAEEAIRAYRNAIVLQPDLADAHNNLGNALIAARRRDEAIVSFGQALRARPLFVEAWYNLGNVHHETGQFEQAIDCYRKALTVRPDWLPALNNLGRALSSLGRTDEAVAVFGKAIALDSGQPEPHNNLGNALYDAGRLDDAIAAYRGALTVKPDYVDALNNLGNAYKNTARLQQAIESYDRAIAARPDFLVAECNRIFSLTLHPDYSGQAILREQRLWDRRHAAPLAKLQRPHDNNPNPQRRLRIGYLSADFRDHAVGRNLLPLFREHDRQHFEVFLYANVTHPDGMTAILRASCDAWRDVVKLDDQQCADQIRADRVDILVDLSLHSWGNRLLVFARKPAPVQATFGGYPGGTGLTAMDWRLTDPYLDPPGESDADYVERSYRLPDSFWCYDPQATEWDPGGVAPPPVAELPALHNRYITFGCLNNYCKVNDGVLDSWGRVLQSMASSRLLMMAPPGESRRYVLETLTKRGIGAERIDFVTYQPRRLYLAQFDRIDLGLDTLPYNGHTASLDALWMGVPVITRLGQTVVGRAGWSQLSNLGLTELIAHSDEQFVDTAIRWATDWPRLAQLRRTLRQRMLASPLTDGRRFAKNVEAAFTVMWNTWRQGRPASASVTAPSSTVKGKSNRNSNKSASKKSAAVQKLVDRAMRFHRIGELSQAEAVYRKILAKHPAHPDALHLLGALAHQTGRHETAVDLIRRAIAAHPTPHFQINLGAALAAMGRLSEAIFAYRQAIDQKPDLAEAQYGLGELYRGTGQWTEALACFDAALAVRPDWAEAHNNRGMVLWRLGRLDEAVAALRRALALRPQLVEAYSNLGITMRDMGRCEVAIAACRQAIALRPDFAEAYSNLSLALADHKEPEAAASAARKAIELRPDFIEAYINLSAVLRLTGEFEEAMAACRHVIGLRPNFALPYANLASLMTEQGFVEEALDYFDRAIVLDPQDSMVRSRRIFALHWDPNRGARAIFEEHQQWNQRHALPLQSEIQAHHNDPSLHRQLRIGYVSPNLRQHSVAFFLESLLSSHDPTSMQVFCYSDGLHQDETTARLRGHAAVWHDVTALNDAQLANLIRQDRIDILVDLAGHTAGNRLLTFARKPAPVQVTYLGYANTTGVTTVDYRLTDDYADPPGSTESLHSEELVRLPRTFLCYRACDNAPPVGPSPAAGTGRITFGSFNALIKVNAPLIALWARILEKVPGSRIILKGHARTTAEAHKNILQMFCAHNIAPDRIDIRPRISSQVEHLRLYDQIDIALDTFPYHGTTTTCEAMWMGVPVITLAGHVHISRVGVSLLSNVGLPDLIARDAEEYVRLAEDLAGNRGRLIELRTSLRQRMIASPLMDAARFAREVENAYRRMWENWCAAQRRGTLANKSSP
jgi:predicted O-linked N-acetylglucosamine transferase (SPINDLY family)